MRVGGSGGEGSVGGIGLRQSIGGVVAEEGVDLAVHALDLVEAGLGGFAGGDFAPRELRGQFGDGQLVQHRQAIRPATRASGYACGLQAHVKSQAVSAGRHIEQC